MYFGSMRRMIALLERGPPPNVGPFATLSQPVNQCLLDRNVGSSWYFVVSWLVGRWWV